MAQRIQVVLIDDIDGGDADETLTFAFDGASYEIDLSTANAERFRQVLAPYIGHARRSAKGAGRRARPSAGSPGATSNRTDRSAQIRAWARSQGISVNERGRVPSDVAARFDAAHAVGNGEGSASSPATHGDGGTAIGSPFR